MIKLIFNWITAIRRRRLLWTVLSLCFFLLTVSLVSYKGKCLYTPSAPRGILSLELSWKTEKAERIRAEWDSKVCAMGDPSTTSANTLATNDAIIQTIYDSILFIPAYVIFLVVLIALRRNLAADDWTDLNRTKNVILLALVAGLCDYIENFFMFQFLDGNSMPSVLFAVPATIKIISLLIVVGHVLWSRLSRVTNFSRRFATVLWANRVGVFGLIVIYLLLWKVDQGQDLLLNLNSHRSSVVAFYVVLLTLALVNWHLPKFLNKKTPPTAATPFPPGTLRNVPRLLGVATFLIPACGILNALVVMKAPGMDGKFLEVLPILTLLATLGIFMFAFERNIFDNLFNTVHQKYGHARLYYFIIAALWLSIIGLGFLNEGSPMDLRFLTLGLYLLAISFAMIVSVRQERKFFEGVFARFQHRSINNFVIAVGAIASAIFLIMNFIPVQMSQMHLSRFLTMPLVFTGIVFYTMLFYGLLIRGRIDRINWSLILIVSGIVMAVIVDNKFHDVYRVTRTNQSDLEPLAKNFQNWVKDTDDVIQRLPQGKKYPVYIVNTYGGGIRAAAWTSLVVGHLDSVTHGEFQRHVFAYSGASGGTIGASVMCVTRKTMGSKPFTPHNVVKFYENDFLTPVLIGLLGRDVFFSTTGWDAIEDRARVQDHTWETHLEKTIGRPLYSEEFGSLWFKELDSMQVRDYDIPLLFSNTYHVESGIKAILAPVKISSSDFPQAVIVNERLNGMSVPFSTGAFLSARFPYISPAGKMDSVHHFLDGGLKENSGAETASELFDLIKQIKVEQEEKKDTIVDRQRNWDDLFAKLEIYFISLNNAGNNDRADEPAKNLVEITAPATALYNNWVGNTLRADAQLKVKYDSNYIQLRPLKDLVHCDGNDMVPVLPLGWQISSCALRRLKESLSVKENDLKIQRIASRVK